MVLCKIKNFLSITGILKTLSCSSSNNDYIEMEKDNFLEKELRNSTENEKI